MLFHQGRYLGITTKCAFGFTSIGTTSNDSIGVTYKWPRQGESNAASSGRASVNYRWSGSAVQMQGTLPAELLAISGCQP
ncbi:MAG: LppP/LprE family lipoprotein [Actinomycetota bacterium]|nr:LppP/LprE family lipoprotein [Actinomycetota bacterium]